MSNNSNVPHITLSVQESVVESSNYLQSDLESSSIAESRRRNIRRSIAEFTNVKQTPTSTRRFFDNLIQTPLSYRQQAEIQLNILLDESNQTLAAFVPTGSQFKKDDKISIEEVSKLLNTQPFIIERLFAALFPESKGSDSNVTLFKRSEIIKITRILNSTTDVKALLFFMIIDEDGDRFVTNQEFRAFYERYLSDVQAFDNDRRQAVINALFQKFDLHEKTKIDFEDFYVIVLNDALLLQTLAHFTVNPTWYQEGPSKKTSKNCVRRIYDNIREQKRTDEVRGRKLSREYIKNNLVRILFLLFYILINIGLTVYVVLYRLSVTTTNVEYVVIARVGGMLLNFNCALITIVMLKKVILFVRGNRLLRKLIPVDDHIDFHKMIGRFIGLLSLMHTIAHLLNFGRQPTITWAQALFTTKLPLGLIPGAASITGIILCAIFTIMIVFSMQWIRRGGHFQIFYWTHLLYIPFFVALILHAPNCWKWVIGPLTLLFAEKLYSLITRYSSNSGRTYLHSATIEQSNVISLTIHRPKNFTFRPGDYISINLPSVAVYEYHPFTISSAPEEANYLRVHIQACGNWTKRVYQKFKEMSEEVQNEKHVKVYHADFQRVFSDRETANHNANEADHDEFDDDSTDSSPTNPNGKSKIREQVFIKGPFSSCARYIFDCKHVVLVGGGIGVTPYASILSSLMAQFRSSRLICKHCSGINYRFDGAMMDRKLKKVDFIWVNRDHKNFEWFLNILREIEDEQEKYLSSNPNEKRFLDIHLYFTAIKNEHNIGNAPLDLISRVWEQVAGQDIFTTLKSRTRVGRPDWSEVFGQLVTGEGASKPNDISVFFCGPPAMARNVENECASYRIRFYEEKF